MRKFYNYLGIKTAFLLMVSPLLFEGFWKSSNPDQKQLSYGLINTAIILIHWSGWWIWTKEIMKPKI